MPRYRSVWLEIALEQYAALPAEAQRQIDARVEELVENPYQPRSAYDERTDQWATTYGGGAGLILASTDPGGTGLVLGASQGTLHVGAGTLPGMAGPDDLETRVAALETQVRELVERVRSSEQDAAAARVLAGGADRDVTEIRGEIREFREQNTRVLNAMRADVTDLRQRVDNGFAEMRGKLDATAAGQQQIVTLLNTLIAREDPPHDQ